VLWSLSVEEVFYLSFPLLCLLLRHKARLLAFWAMVIVAGPLYRLAVNQRRCGTQRNSAFPTQCGADQRRNPLLTHTLGHEGMLGCPPFRSARRNEIGATHDSKLSLDLAAYRGRQVPFVECPHRPDNCESAWKSVPAYGVISVETGPTPGM